MTKQEHIGWVTRTSVLVALVLFSGAALASKAGQHRAYVQSGPDRLGSVFYARCVPSGDRGTAGRTQVYQVRGEGDHKVDAYDWYAPGGMVLGWSPIAGKVAVLSLMHDGAAEDWKTQEAIRFSLGGERLASYTNGELIEMGASMAADSADGLHAGFRVIGCEQIPGTNEYDFVIGIDAGKTLRFDITTGRPRQAKR
jgi:hypothetical protein